VKPSKYTQKVVCPARKALPFQSSASFTRWPTTSTPRTLPRSRKKQRAPDQ
jgi:hypothetical protein